MGKSRLIFLIILLLLCALPVSAATGIISISAPVGSELTLYRVGEQTGEQITLTQAFAETQVTLTQVHDPQAAQQLADYAQKNNIPGLVGQCDETEQIYFDDLQQGVYLVVQTKSANGYAPIAPFLFSIPEGDRYAVEASPKQLPQESTTQPENATPETGDRKYLLMFPAASAALFSLAGLLLCTLNQKNRRG